MTKRVEEIRAELRVMTRLLQEYSEPAGICQGESVHYWIEDLRTVLNELDLANASGAGIASLLLDVQRDCVENRKALRDLLELVTREVDSKSFSNGVTDPTGTYDQGQAMAGEIIENARKLVCRV